ncbi:MAG TPA: hypothetical protein PKJ19_16400 [Flavobacteriales bacterium]|nr:hypothetical protein [Flavobacteriales bacterium]HNU57113.1 hypothetical protein [Flavobacteriales bacterium]
MTWNPTEEGWSLVYDAPGIGCVYHATMQGSAQQEDDDGPEIDRINDEGEEDQEASDGDVWMIRYAGREKFTKTSEAYARELLTMATMNQLELFA